jgi:hypothetical protein
MIGQSANVGLPNIEEPTSDDSEDFLVEVQVTVTRENANRTVRDEAVRVVGWTVVSDDGSEPHEVADLMIQGAVKARRSTEK